MRITGMWAGIAAVGCLAGSLHAQQQWLAQGNRESAPAQAPARAGLSQRISVSLNRVTIPEGLAEITRKTGVTFDYAVALLPAGRRVSLELTNMPAREAIARMLAGSGLQLGREGDGSAALVRASVSAKAQGVIVGRVVHAKTKRPLEGVRVTLGDGTSAVVTDKDGQFRLPAPAGSHAVQARAVGFTRHAQQVVVDGNETVTVQLELEPSASVLDEVIVTGTVVQTERRALPAPITVITAADIEKRGITRIEQLFRGEVPGVYAINTGTQAYTETSKLGGNVEAPVYSRGSASLDDGSANPLKTYIDGVELLNHAYLGAIDPASIERIEILVGPQAVTIYGSDAMGGVMQIFTKKGSSTRRMDAQLQLRYGMLESNLSQGLTPSHQHAVQVNGGAGPELSYSGNVSYQYVGQWQPGLYSRTTGVSLGVTHTKNALTASGSASTQMVQNGTINSSPGITPCGYSTTGGCVATPYTYQLMNSGQQSPNYVATGRIFSQRIAKSGSQTFALNIDYRAHPLWGQRLTLGRSYTQLEKRPDRPMYSRVGEDTLWVTGRNAGQRTTFGYNTTIAPRFGWISSSVTLGMNGSSGDQSAIEGCLATAVSSSYIGCYSGQALTPTAQTFKSWGGFGSWQLGIWDRLFVTLGIRGERNPNYGRAHKVDWTPSNGATYVADLGDLTVKLLGSYGRSTRPPNPEWRLGKIETRSDMDVGTYVAQLEAPLLTPEYTRGPQGGIELYYKNVGSLTVNRFTQTVHDMIQQVAVDSIYATYLEFVYSQWLMTIQYVNTAEIKNQGWESTASLNIWRFSLRGTYSWTDSRVQAINPNARIGVNGCCAYRGLRPGQLFTYVPTHTGNVVASYAWGGTSATLTANWRGASLQRQNSALELARAMYGRLPMYSVSNPRSSPQAAIPGHTTSNLVVSQRISTNIAGTLNVMNLSDSYHSDAGAWWPTLGRQTLLGVSLRWPNR